MKTHLYCLVATLLGAAVAWGQQRDAPIVRSDAVDGVEVLTRGPVHEAFAETISFDPEPGLVVLKTAPEPIEELPPEQKPEGANVDWIPGYWAWDDERDDFLWISGIWRSLPPGRQWVPGYWTEARRGSQWISGYWADARAVEIDYLPEPPATLEAGPNIDPPSVDYTWLPGCWIWHQNRYVWRPGVWAEAQPNWVWIPAHYVWSPRGYVFLDGYYDYSVARRGVLFAPVYFSSIIYSQRGYSYSPVTVINPAVFTTHLFLRPSYGHYYFGDYYSASYTTSGFAPSFSFYASRSGYDPFCAHQRWHHRSDREWHRRVEADYAHRRDHEEARPPRTWAAQRERSGRDPANSDNSFVVVAALDDLAKSKTSAFRFQALAQEERQQLEERGQQVRKFREERQQLEAIAHEPSEAAPERTQRPVKVKIPRTPIASRPIAQLGDDAPPQGIEPPKPDVSIEPKPRKKRVNVELSGRSSKEPKDPKETSREPGRERPVAEAPPMSERKPGPGSEPKRKKSRGNAEPPQAEPRPEPPMAEPRPQPPKDEPKPERPPVEPKPEAPKVQPTEKPERGPKVPADEPEDRPKGSSQGKGKGKNKPQG